MALLNDILAWSNGLPGWQCDALRRLFQKARLGTQDIDELYILLKASHGLPNPADLQPQPLAQSHLPATGSSVTTVVLAAMYDLKNVNIIGPTERLSMAAAGVTVIYGGNGSGKSGYARVLKRACRARDTSETVLPDAYDPNAVSSVPSAAFDVMDGGVAKTLHWRQDQASPDDLSSIAVFDGKCARAYLDEEQDVAFLPYGLDIVESLGQSVIPQMGAKLRAEIATVNVDTAPFADLVSSTRVGQVISTLSHKTDPNVVTKLASLSEAEQTRLKEIDATLTEADPAAKAKTLRLAAGRIVGLRSRIETAVAAVSDTRVQTEKTIDDQAESAHAAEKAVAEQFRGGEPLLPGTGDQLWKALMEAAETYSTQVAYSGLAFPHVGSDAQCVLCQQPLLDTAADRLKRFDAFLRDQTSKDAKDKASKCTAALQALERTSVSFQFDPIFADELSQYDQALGQRVTAMEASIDARRKAMIAAYRSHDWKTIPAVGGDVRPALDKIVESLNQQAGEMDKAADVALKKKLETERAELKARHGLSKRVQGVLDLIERMKLHRQLETCSQDLNTKGISDKVKDFTSSAVTEALRKSLDQEFQELGVGYIRTKLTERVEKGKTKHKLILDLPRNRPINAILSEGEQRAIAIGSFLAELGQSGNTAGIIFDDPVSSLDHEHRRQVARRLVREAKTRQVVIFTHDAAFLGELRDSLDQSQEKVPYSFCHLEWCNKLAGGVVDGLPWDHQGYKERLNNLKQNQRRLTQRWPAHPGSVDIDAMRDAYSKLRATIERVVQDLVLNGVVQRYSDYVHVNRLQAVVVLEDADCQEIERLITKCHSITSAHDPSAAKNSSLPLPNELGQDMADLERVISDLIKRRKASVSKPSGSGT